MQFYPLPILLTTIIVLIASYYRVSIRYLVLFFIPWASTGWFYLDFGTTIIKPVQLLFVVLLFIVLQKSLIRKSVAISALIMLSPFLISVAYNLFFFTPVETFEIESTVREARAEFRTSLNITNFTRLVYLIFGLLMYTVCASIYWDKAKLKKIIDYTLYFVCAVSILQVSTWYLGRYEIYETIFSPQGSAMNKQMAGFLGVLIKRINAIHQEPSFLGFYLTCTLLFYITFFGRKIFFNSRPIWFTIILGVFTTSTTFVWGFAGVFIIIYLFYTKRRHQILFYFALLIFAAYIFSTFTVYGFIESKPGSVPFRWLHGWTIPSQAILKSPFFGYALGTSFTQFIFTLLPHSIGFIGLIIFMFGLLKLPTSKAKKIYLFGILWLGIGNFYFASVEMWAYLGLLSNPIFRDQEI